jgi:hypothetical protein
MAALNLQHPVSRQMQQLLKAGWSLQLVWIATVALYLMLYTILGMHQHEKAACEEQHLATAAHSSTPCSAATFGHVLQSAVLGGSFTVMLAVLLVLWVCEVLAWFGVGVSSTPAHCSNIQVLQQLSKLHQPTDFKTYKGLKLYAAASSVTKGSADSKQHQAAGQLLQPQQQHACANPTGQHAGHTGRHQQLHSSAAERAAPYVQLPITANQHSHRQAVCSSRLASAGQDVSATQQPLHQLQHLHDFTGAADQISTALQPLAVPLGASVACHAGALVSQPVVPPPCSLPFSQPSCSFAAAAVLRHTYTCYSNRCCHGEVAAWAVCHHIE